MYSHLWSIPEFRRLLAARMVSNFGNGMGPIAMSFGVLDLKVGGPKELSWILAAQAVALVLVLPFGGVWADRLSRARVIATTDSILSTLIVLVGVLFLTDVVEIWMLILINFMAGALNALWYPAFPGLTPETVRDQHLQEANAAIAMGSNSALVAGTAAGGALVAFLGAGYAFILDGLTFLVAALLVFSIRHVSVPHPGEKNSMLIELRDGWKTFVSYKWIAIIVGAFSIIAALWMGSNGVLGPYLMKEEYNGPTSWAIVTGSVSVGMLCGALIGGKFRPKRPMIIAMLMTIAAPAWILSMAAGLPLGLISLAALAWGLAIEIFGVFWFTALQTHVPRESFSRVASYDAFGSMLLGPLGVALAGPAVTWIGVHNALWVAGSVILIMIAVPLLSKEVWRVQWLEARGISADRAEPETAS